MDVVIKPRVKTAPTSAGKRIKNGIIVIAFIVIPLLVARAVFVTISGTILDAILFVLVALFLSPILFVPMLNKRVQQHASVFVRGDTVGMASWRGGRYMFPRSELARIVVRSVNVGAPAPLVYTIFVSQTGRCLFKLASHQWDAKDVRHICKACKVPLEGSWDDDSVSTPAQVNAEIGGSFPRLLALLIRK